MLNYINLNQSDCNLLKWTEGAVECYRIGCNCSKCIQAHPTDKCYMKSFVLQLVRVLGSPEVALTKQQEEEKLKLLILSKADELLKKGAHRGWKKTLARQLNISYSKMLYILQQNNIKEYTYFKNKEREQ